VQNNQLKEFCRPYFFYFCSNDCASDARNNRLITPKMSRIVIIGSSNIDLTVKTSHIPAKGETIFGNNLEMAFGGKGANQAVAACRLGGDVSFIAKTGGDSYGDMMLTNFAKEGLNTDSIIRSAGSSSGLAWICVDECGDNAIIVMPGANGAMTPDDLKPYLHLIQNADYLLMQLEVPMDVVEYAAEVASASGVKVILNPAPAQPLTDSLLSKLFMIVPNEKESQMVCGDQASADYLQNADILRKRGVKNVIVTLGEKGSYLCGEDGCVEVPAIKVNAVDTVAAGDTYCGALVVALSEGKTMEEAMMFATKASAVSVTRSGAQPSIPYINEVL
jgi:ribokinase